MEKCGVLAVVLFINAYAGLAQRTNRAVVASIALTASAFPSGLSAGVGADTYQGSKSQGILGIWEAGN